MRRRIGSAWMTDRHRQGAMEGGSGRRHAGGVSDGFAAACRHGGDVSVNPWRAFPDEVAGAAGRLVVAGLVSGG